MTSILAVLASDQVAAVPLAVLLAQGRAVNGPAPSGQVCLGPWAAWPFSAGMRA